MDIEYLDGTEEIGEAFINRFVLSWESFQIVQKDWISEMSKRNYLIDKKWYDSAYMWEKMAPTSSHVSMKEALDFLRKHSGKVLLMTEKNEPKYFNRKRIDYIAGTDAHQLADRIEYEWYNSYELIEQYMYIPDALPCDLYVFDSSMKWCVVFTHETTDWEAEKNGDMMKAAQSRYCIICKE